MTTQARNAASIKRAAVLRWTVLTQRRLSHSSILCWQLYWTRCKRGRRPIAERRGDAWTDGNSAGRNRLLTELKQQDGFSLLTFCRRSCCWLYEPVLKVSGKRQFCSNCPDCCSCWKLLLVYVGQKGSGLTLRSFSYSHSLGSLWHSFSGFDLWPLSFWFY